VNTRRVTIYFALTFLLGVLAGGAGMFFYGWRMSALPTGAARRERILRRMTRDLSLNDTQVQKIRSIMEETGGKIGELRKQHRPEYDAVRNESHDRIRKELTPEQAVKFEEMVRRFEERRKRGDAPPPPPPD